VLTDGDQIRNLLAEYCDLVDAGDLEGVGLLMADASLHTLDGTEIARGAEAITDLYRGLVKLHADGTPRTQHLVTNVHLTPQDDGTVKAQSVFVVLQATDRLPLQPVITGRYVDVLEPRPDGGWRFARRAFGPALTGTLTEHMEIELS
jgi:ketosteroid isomerase-like protein